MNQRTVMSVVGMLILFIGVLGVCYAPCIKDGKKGTLISLVSLIFLVAGYRMVFYSV